MNLIVLITAVSVLASYSLEETFHAKITGPAHNSQYYPISSSDPKTLTLRAPPANISGPPHLQQLAGHCFRTKEKSYTYSVCPFHNVTQEEDKTSWNSYRGVLGVWREWIVEGDRFTGMLFEMGEKCSSGDRAVKVMLNCSTITLLHNITEPHTCKYTMWLHTPLACFKGAMQVYHLLTPHQIEGWDSIMQEYLAKEITKKGMRKRQRSILMEAGLAYNFTIDDLYRKQEQQVSLPAWSSLTNSLSHIDECSKRKEELEDEIQSLKKELSVLKQAIESDPAVKSVVEMLINKTFRAATNSTTQTVANSSHIAENPTHTTANSTHNPSNIASTIYSKSNSAKGNGHKAAVITPVSTTHRQEARNGDPNNDSDHSDHFDIGNRQQYKRHNTDRLAADSDDVVVANGAANDMLAAATKGRDTIRDNHPVENHERKYAQQPQVSTEKGTKTSKKRKQSQIVSSKSSLAGGDTQPVDVDLKEKRIRKLDKVVKAPD